MLEKPKRLNVLPNNPEEIGEAQAVGPGRFPSWLHRRLPKGNILLQTDRILSKNRLHTVCEEAKCPNLFECWSHKTATFLVMGKECTRNCGFCDIDFNKTPKPLDLEEPIRVSHSVSELGLKHVVLTMVARDDLEDGGSKHLVQVLHAIRNDNPQVTLEVLTSDFNGNKEAWLSIIEAQPQIFNHNIETVLRLSPRVRHRATYERTLTLLHFVANHPKRKNILVKSGLMVGLGETEDEVFQTLKDLKEHGCNIVTIGQYLQPNQKKLLVKEFIPPEQFLKYEEFGYNLGFSYVYSGPFVRSSYNAGIIFEKTHQAAN